MQRHLFIFLTVTLFVVFASSTASAQSDELVRYAPRSANMVVGLNLGALKSAPVYREAIEFLKAQPNIGATIGFLQTDGGLDIERDLDAVVVALPEAATDPNQSTMTFIVRGKFDPERLIEASKKRFEGLSETTEGTVTRYTTPDFTFGFATPSDLVITMGESAFQLDSWSAVPDEKKSAKANKSINGQMAQINTTRGVWMAVDTRSLPQQGPKMNTAGFTVDILGGLKLELVGNMADAKGAKEAAKQFDDLKKQKDSPMVAMFGAAPLMKNLKANAKGKIVTATTSMNQGEFDTMLKQVKAIMAQGMQATPGTLPTKPTPPPAGTSDTGAKADFN